MNKYLFFPVALLVVAGLAGCGGIRVASQVAGSTSVGNYDAALALLEKEKKQYSGPNNLLYYFERGTLLQRVENYNDSTKDLGSAEQLIEELYGTSVSQAALSFLVNDMTMDYTGEDFEQVMVNVVKGLNFLFADNLPGALVEARKVNTRLTQLSGKYGQEAIYKEDAFARYLAAFIQEADHQYNDAYIDYKYAYKNFLWYQKQYGMPVPQLIKTDLLRLSLWLGFNEDHQMWRKEFGEDSLDAEQHSRKKSEVLLVIYDGIIPEKQTRYTAGMVESDGHPYTFKVAFPVIKPRPNVVNKIRVGLPDGTVCESEVMEPLDAIAIQNLDQRIGLITVKAMARATAKYIAALQARRVAGNTPLANLATNLFTFMTEQADTRSWRTLPNRFHVARFTLPAGAHTLELRVETIRGDTRALPPLAIELKKGQKKVIPIYVTQ